MQDAQQPSAEFADALVRNHREFLAFVERRVGNSADAEEILQAAFVKGLEQAGSVRDEQRVVAWFYRVLRNALIDHARRREAEGRTLEHEAEALDPALPPPELERAICQCVHDLLPGLKPDYANLLRRVDLGSESIAEVAQDLDLTPNNTRVKLHRARAALRKQLQVCCGTCTEHGCLDCTCGRPSGSV